MSGDLLRKVKKELLKKSIARHEKTCNHLYYCLFQEKRNRDLVLVFSGFPGANSPAKYNYINTLLTVKTNKLFLLDDVPNPVNNGSYYLGKDGDWYYIDDITGLVEAVTREYDINRIITVGSSKGGTSALFYGIKLGADACVIGAPQYYIGSYLAAEKHRPILEAVMGDTSQASIDKLNALVKNEIEKDHEKKPTVYLHYSPKEHTYEDHIRDMIRDLRENGYAVSEDNDYTYGTHSDVAKFFPKYLLRTVKSILGS